MMSLMMHRLLLTLLTIYLSLFTGTIACDHYARECEFGILKKKQKKKKKKKNKKNLAAVF